MTNPTSLSRPKTRNPVTQARMRRDVVWQIVAPLVVIFGGLAVLGYLAGWTASSGTRSAAADAALIMLMCPAAVVAVVVLALVAGLVVGMVFALRELPYLLKRVQDVLVLAVYYTQKYAGRVSNMFVDTRSNLAASQRTTEHIWSWMGRRRPK